MVNELNYRKLKRIASIIWPKHSIIIERLNNNALTKKFSEKINAIRLSDSISLYVYLNENLLKNAAIDYLEFGTAEGGTIKAWLSLNTNPTSRFFGFDTFTGLPEDWFGNFKRGVFDTGGSTPSLSDKRVKFIKGLFQEKLDDFLHNFERTGDRAIIHIDADLYSSTLYVLTKLDSFFLKGDILLFDDFLDPIGEFKAYKDWVKSYRKTLIPIAYVGYNKFIDKIAFIFEDKSPKVS